jgi:hypothetical protein
MKKANGKTNVKNTNKAVAAMTDKKKEEIMNALIVRYKQAIKKLALM